MQNVKLERSIRWKLAVAFMAVACFVAAYVGVAIGIHFETLERAAQLEAGHVAELIADTATEKNHVRSSLQDYVVRMHAMRKRDITVVDAGKRELADDNPDDIGKTYGGDPGNEVGRTISDGRTRTFIEKSDQHPDGAH